MRLGLVAGLFIAAVGGWAFWVQNYSAAAYACDARGGTMFLNGCFAVSVHKID